MMKSLVRLVLLVLLFVAVMPVLAQEVTETPPAVIPVEPLPDGDAPVIITPVEPLPAADFLSNLLRLVNDLTYVPFLVVGVVLLGNLTKLGLTRAGLPFNPVFVALFWQIIVWAVYTLFKQAGAETIFLSVWDAAIKIVEALLPLGGTLFLGHSIYSSARAANNPILGYRGKPGGAAYTIYASDGRTATFAENLKEALERDDTRPLGK